MENQKETLGVQPWYLVLRLLAILGLPYLLVQLGEAFHIWARIDQIYYLNKDVFHIILGFFTVAPVGFEALIRIITSNPEPYLNF